jgi:hypothetical protein
LDSTLRVSDSARPAELGLPSRSKAVGGSRAAGSPAGRALDQYLRVPAQALKPWPGCAARTAVRRCLQLHMFAFGLLKRVRFWTYDAALAAVTEPARMCCCTANGSDWTLLLHDAAFKNHSPPPFCLPGLLCDLLRGRVVRRRVTGGVRSCRFDFDVHLSSWS